ncbi:endonuclease domain-containing protein [Cytobacillus sp. FJAT-54145]|uniref:Endonuclease domain-containing protein n=1 Tax=Cytobacillus spartinae TaxID=3299023 RepID=A0ABW6KE07_9BACI
MNPDWIAYLVFGAGVLFFLLAQIKRAPDLEEERNKCGSKLEQTLFDAIAKSDLPLPTLQYKPLPNRKYRLDFAYVLDGGRCKIDVEVDGPHHSLPEQILKDRERDTLLKKHGWKVIRFNQNEVRSRTDWCVEEIRDLLLLYAVKNKRDVKTFTRPRAKTSWFNRRLESPSK